MSSYLFFLCGPGSSAYGPVVVLGPGVGDRCPTALLAVKTNTCVCVCFRRCGRACEADSQQGRCVLLRVSAQQPWKVQRLHQLGGLPHPKEVTPLLLLTQPSCFLAHAGLFWPLVRLRLRWLKRPGPSRSGPGVPAWRGALWLGRPSLLWSLWPLKSESWVSIWCRVFKIRISLVLSS